MGKAHIFPASAGGCGKEGREAFRGGGDRVVRADSKQGLSEGK